MLHPEAIGTEFTSALEISVAADYTLRTLLSQPWTAEEAALTQAANQADWAVLAGYGPAAPPPNPGYDGQLFPDAPALARPAPRPPAHPAMAWRVLSGAVWRALLDGDLGVDYYQTAPLEVELEWLAAIPVATPIICTARCTGVEEHKRHGTLLCMEVSGRVPKAEQLFRGAIVWRCKSRRFGGKKRPKRSLPPIAEPGGAVRALPHKEPWDKTKNAVIAELFREADPIYLTQKAAKQAGFKRRVMPWMGFFALFTKVGSFLAEGLYHLRAVKLSFLGTPYAVPLVFDKPLQDEEGFELEAFGPDGKVVARAKFDLGEVVARKQRIEALRERVLDDDEALEELVGYMAEGDERAMEIFQERQRKVHELVQQAVDEGKAKAEAIQADADQKREAFAQEKAAWRAENPDAPEPEPARIAPAVVPEPKAIPLPAEIARFLEGVPRVPGEELLQGEPEAAADGPAPDPDGAPVQDSGAGPPAEAAAEAPPQA